MLIRGVTVWKDFYDLFAPKLISYINSFIVPDYHIGVLDLAKLLLIDV